MKILCLHEERTASARLGWAQVCSAIGDQIIFWQPEMKPAFDAFLELEPDLFIGTTDRLDRATLKCLKTQGVKAILETREYSDKDAEKVQQVKPEFLFTTTTMGPNLWAHSGKLIYLPEALDCITYKPGKVRPELSSDITYVNDRPTDSTATFLYPLCFQDNLRVKIFGIEGWGLAQHLGYINHQEEKDAFASAKICLSLNSIEQAFKIVGSGGFCIAAKTDTSMFGNEIPTAQTAEELVEKVYYHLNNVEKNREISEKARKLALQEHTYFDRMLTMYTHLNMEDKQEKVQEVKSTYV